MLFLYQVEFQYRIEDDDTWHQQTVHHLGDDDGSRVIQYVHDHFMGSDVELTVKGQDGATAKLTKKVISWRFSSAMQLYQVTTIDLDAMAEHGLIDPRTAA